MGMGKYILQRLLFTVLVILGISIMVFLVTHVIGDPVAVMLPLEASQEQRIEMARQLGLDQPLLVQLGDFLADAARLDFGMSWWLRIPCIDVVAEKLPNSLYLITLSCTIAVLVSIPLGILAAYRPGSLLDRFLSGASLVGICVPSFWIGLMLMLIFAVKLGWFYTSGIGTWRHIILPAVTIAFRPTGHLAQIVRFEMIQQLNSNYVITARAKGVKEMVVLFKHALKNIMTSTITMIGSDYTKLLGGLSATVEVVYGWPGFGSLITDTINNLDYPLLQTEVFVVAIFVCMINLAVDILYAAFDPRIRY